MTADAYLVIRCDAAEETEADGRCSAEAHWPVRFEPHTHRQLRRLLKDRDGWRWVRDGRDLCPDHATRDASGSGASIPRPSLASTLPTGRTGMTDHEPEPWFWEAASEHCPHGPEPEDDTTDAWDEWRDRHTGSPQDVRICRDAPIGDACAECSAESGEFVPWSACASRPRRKDKPMPAQAAIHRPVTVEVADLECLERECDDFFTDDGDEIPGKTTCSHLHDMEICEACSEPGAADDYPPVVAWTDCPNHSATVNKEPAR